MDRVCFYLIVFTGPAGLAGSFTGCLQSRHYFRDAAFKLRIFSVQSRLRIVVHFNVRIDAVAFDDPLAFRVGQARAGTEDPAAID